jgi:hypothetical protein
MLPRRVAWQTSVEMRLRADSWPERFDLIAMNEKPHTVDFTADEFFTSIFRYFGTRSTTFVMFSGVVISGLGLKEVINPTVWLGASVSAMILSYSLRGYISERYLAVLLACILVMSSTIPAAFYMFYRYVAPNVPIPREYQFFLFSFLIFFIITFPICIIIVSYKKYMQSVLSDLPESISTSLRDFVQDMSFYYESFTYVVEMFETEAKNEIKLRATTSMELRNRKGIRQSHVSRYPTPTKNYTIDSIKINGEPRDLDDPQIRSSAGISLSNTVEPNEKITIEVIKTEIFENNSNELYTAYNFPCEKFSFSVTNHAEHRFRVWLEMLNKQQHIAPKREGKILTWKSEYAILPNQGVRMFWGER